MKQRLLLHICCATCAAYVLEKLAHNYDVAGFYYNPNIYPEREYAIRRNEAKAFCASNNIEYIEQPPDQDRWFTLTAGHEEDQEKGERCTICYRMRLEMTAQYAKELGFDIFGTDLSISPHKDAQRLNTLGKELSEQYSVRYLEADFKKQDGFKHAIHISREQGFYRQNYCGCKYSMQDRDIEKNGK